MIFDKIGAGIEEKLRGYEGKVGLVLRDLKGGDTLSIGEDLPFASASMIKVPIMWELFRRVELGEIDLDGSYTLLDAVKVGRSVYDSGILRDMHQGLVLTYRDILTLMIIISDDTATNILLDLLGMDAINATMADLGLGGIKARRRMMDYEKVMQGIDNTMTAGDLDRLLQYILQGPKMAPSLRAEMLTVLAKQQINTAIPIYLSPKLKIAHKTGSILEFALEHDGGIVYNMQEEPVLAISIFTKELPNNREIIGRIAQEAFAAITEK